MKIFIFKTDIKTDRQVRILTSVFSDLKGVSRWSVDIQDVDRVLRIVTLIDSNENDFIDLIKKQGFVCEVLPDQL